MIGRYLQTIIPGPAGRITWHRADEGELQDLGRLDDGYRYLLLPDEIPPQPDDVTIETLSEPPVAALREQSPVIIRQDDGMVQIREQLRGVFGVTLGDFLEISHKQFGSQWGWRAVMRVQSEDFTPGVRAVAIYSDADHTEYLYTTGAFTWDAEAGEWATQWNESKANKTDIHYAILYASLVENAGTLRAEDDSSTSFFLYGVPSATVPGGEEWVDTGVTVTQLVGAGVYRVSGITELIFDQQIRLGETEAGETVFKGYWPSVGTPSDYLNIAPHVEVAVGAKVYKWS